MGKPKLRYALHLPLALAALSLFLLPSTFAQDATAAKPDPKKEEAAALLACAKAVLAGFRPIAPTRDVRFEGKVSEANAVCRGGQQTLQFRLTPWVDWQQYWGTGDMSSLPSGFLSTKGPEFRGVTGALTDLEFERVELIKFNLFDNTGTYKDFIEGRDGTNGPAVKVWPQLRLPAQSPALQA